MVERFLLYPSHAASLLRVRKGIFRTVGALDVKVCKSDEPISLKEAGKTGFSAIKKGEKWATDYGCAVFGFTGIVPLGAKGRKVVALIDIQGEGLMMKDGVPKIGITQVTDGIDWVPVRRGRR